MPGLIARFAGLTSASSSVRAIMDDKGIWLAGARTNTGAE
jgi:hypothetical protein